MSTLFTSCALTHLTKLHLYAESSSAAAALSSDTTILDFIVSHPSIEDLKWYPRDERLEIPQGVLPNLRRLYTKDRIAKILLNDTSVAGSRKIEVISQISLGSNTVNLLQNMDGTNIQELHLWRFEDLEQIDGISGLFPNIKTIDIPNIIQAGRNTVVSLLFAYRTCIIGRRLTSDSRTTVLKRCRAFRCWSDSLIRRFGLRCTPCHRTSSRILSTG